ncbi:MAG: DUF4331 family protein [Lysobacter sp.]|nr:DUF4331 family protein [Lysobacter sp.]
MNHTTHRSRRAIGWALGLLALVAGLAHAGDHREAPRIADQPTLDVQDFYSFISPSDPGKLVMVMTVNGFALGPPAHTYLFSDRGRYKFHIDNNGDARTDHLVSMRFSREEYATFTSETDYKSQKFFAGFSMGPQRLLSGMTTPASPVFDRAFPPVIVEGGGARVFAGTRDDPFFFDVVDSDRTFAGVQPKFRSGKDRFAGYNVSAIVVEIPLASVYRGRPLRLWATVDERGLDGRWRQVQRVGNPAVKGVYVPDTMTALFNATSPHQDARLFKSTIQNSARTLFRLDEPTVAQLTRILVPDTLTLDPRQPTRSPNGRALDDDLDLMFWFNLQAPIAYAPGDLDGVRRNDVPNSTRFPYLAPPHVLAE